MSARSRAVKREAAQHRDALALLVQGRRTGGLPGGKMTGSNGVERRVEPLPDRELSYISAGNEITCPTGGDGAIHASPGEIAAAFAGDVRKGSRPTSAARAQWNWKPTTAGATPHSNVTADASAAD